jgi:hypothetical protein
VIRTRSARNTGSPRGGDQTSAPVDITLVCGRVPVHLPAATTEEP